MTGTHVGCDTTQCGACTVHIDGLPIKSCTILARQVELKGSEPLRCLLSRACADALTRFELRM